MSQIHIAFQGFEIERISDPIIRMRADRAYLFIYKDEKTEKFIDEYKTIEKQLKDNNIEVIQKGIDLLDYIAVIQNISKIIQDERKKDPGVQIYINISVGTKITAIAGFDACRFWDCSTYYVRGEVYISEKEITKDTRTLSLGKMETLKPPIFNLNKPASNLIDALKIIAERKTGIYKKDFIKKLLAKSLLIVQKEYEDREALKKRSAEYMALNHQYIRPLRDDWNYIHVSEARRNQKITLTELGEEAIQIFKYLS